MDTAQAAPMRASLLSGSSCVLQKRPSNPGSLSSLGCRQSTRSTAGEPPRCAAHGLGPRRPRQQAQWVPGEVPSSPGEGGILKLLLGHKTGP